MTSKTPSITNINNLITAPIGMVINSILSNPIITLNDNIGLGTPNITDTIHKEYAPAMEYTDDGTYIIVTCAGQTLFKYRKSDEQTLLSMGYDTDTTL